MYMNKYENKFNVVLRLFPNKCGNWMMDEEQVKSLSKVICDEIER